MIDHCIENQTGVLIAIVLDTTDNLLDIVCSQVGIETCLARNVSDWDAIKTSVRQNVKK